jgi:hypothetical protein
VSEALHKGIPVVATRTGGIPLQIKDGKSGFLVEVGDHEAVAKHLYDLISDKELYSRMSNFAAHNVSDEVGTVGNALTWLFLADTLTRGEVVKPAGRWLNDLAREKSGIPFVQDDNCLPRDLSITNLALSERF